MSFWKTICTCWYKLTSYPINWHFKSYTARLLIDYLQAINAERLVKQLIWFRKAHKTDRDYQLWEEGSYPQMIENPDILRQKLDYIHLNPVKRGYVDLPGHWRYSSARNYAGRERLRQFIGIDFS